MEANELRIGNYVHIVDEDGNKEELKVNLNDICNIESTIDKEMFEPIPLTEDWLLKFGFEKSTQPNGTIFYGNLAFGMRVIGHPYNDGFILFGYEGSVDIEYLHQLQNLYFALTQTELKIKL